MSDEKNEQKAPPQMRTDLSEAEKYAIYQMNKIIGDNDDPKQAEVEYINRQQIGFKPTGPR